MDIITWPLVYLYNVVPEEPGEGLGQADVVFLRQLVLLRMNWQRYCAFDQSPYGYYGQLSAGFHQGNNLAARWLTHG